MADGLKSKQISQEALPLKAQLKKPFRKDQKLSLLSNIKGISLLASSLSAVCTELTHPLTHPSRLIEDVDPVENDVLHAASAISSSVTSV